MSKWSLYRVHNYSKGPWSLEHNKTIRTSDIEVLFHTSEVVVYRTRRRHQTTHAFPITIRGVTYPSRQAAALALNVSESAVHKAIKQNRLETLGLTSRRVPVTLDGITYPSMRACSVATGVPVHKLRIK